MTKESPKIFFTWVNQPQQEEIHTNWKNASARDLRKYSFTNRVVDLWNSLPDTIVTSKTIHQFENRLEKYWENHHMKFDYNSEYGPPTGRKTVKVEEDDEEELPIEDQKVLRAETT